MPKLQPKHRELIHRASNNNDEATPHNHSEEQYLKDLLSWKLVDEEFVLTKLGKDAAVNIEEGIPVFVYG